MSRRRLPSRLLPKITCLLLSFAAITVLALYATGALAASSFKHLAYAALLGLGSSLVWEVVERQVNAVDAGRRRTPHASAWLAFPLAVLLFFGQFPFIALSVYPPIAEFFERNGRIEAWSVDTPTGRRIEILFPRSVRPSGNNLSVNGRFVPPELFRSSAGVVEWRSPRTLSLAAQPLCAELKIAAIEVLAVNADLHEIHRHADAWPFVYEADGMKVPHQTIRLTPKP